jgi:DNA repair exonuclease SbcCD ATPase subunit
MKLTRLRVRGLRSYASEVEIDLARLGEDGLFAIFGPTGSGKSTILDGIFLALFGRCPRGEASECVSAGAFELGVRLEIDAGNEADPRPLAIERRFRWSRKRDPDAAPNSPDLRGPPRHLPLRIEERTSGEWTPLDTGGRKPEDYLAEQIVRISMSDFQQAVVLPQGELDALLRARPAERRTLVASLFRTEHLGQPLFDALRAREIEVRAELDRLAMAEREITVTPDDIEAARIELALAQAAARASAVTLAAAESRAIDLRLACHLQTARDAASEAHAALRAIRAAPLDPAALALLAPDLDRLATAHDHLAAALTNRLETKAIAITDDDAADAEQARDAARDDAVTAAERAARAASRADDLTHRTARTLELRARAALLEPRARRIAQARQIVSANQLAELAAERHLDAVTDDASRLLRALSADRYALVRTADGAFAVADSALGGLHRPPSTLSGGETFLVSLALALALSERIQLAGRARFDFFFLDEGFGGLDAVTLDAAVSALERLRGPHRVIGMITHLAAIEERMPRRLRVAPGRSGRDASVHLEIGERPREPARSETRSRKKTQQVPGDPANG